MQLAVVVSPPVFVCDPYLTLTKMTFDPDTHDLWPWYLWPLIYRSHNYKFKNMFLEMVTLAFDLRPWPWITWLLTLVTLGNMSNTVCKVFENHIFDMVTLTFTHELDIINVHHHTKFEHPRSNGSTVMNFYLVNFYLVNYFLVQTDKHTDRQTDRRRWCIRAHRAWTQVGSNMHKNLISWKA